MAEGGEDMGNGIQYLFHTELEVRKPYAHRSKQAMVFLG